MARAMLSENLQELLSAYVDGELTPVEYERVMAALRDSTVARDYVKQLRELSAQIKVLPQLTSPKSFSTHYLQHVSKVQRRQRAWRWSAVGAAAAALIAGVTLWFTRPQPLPPGSGPGPVALNHPNVPNTPNAIPDNVTPVKRPVDATWLADLGKQAAEWSLGQWDRVTTGLSDTASYLAAMQRDVDVKTASNRKSVLTAPAKDPNALRAVDVDYIPTIQPNEFNLANFQKYWSKKGLFIADVHSVDTIKTLARLTEACKQHGVTLVLDEEVQQRLTKKLPATFMVYLENVPEETIAKLWATLDELDSWHKSINAHDMSCRSIKLFALADVEERKQFARGLGVKPEKLTPKTAASSNALQAVIVAYYQHRLPESISPHVQQALDGQAGPKSDAVSLLFMVRGNK
jgi:hypothetical protein